MLRILSPKGEGFTAGTLKTAVQGNTAWWNGFMAGLIGWEWEKRCAPAIAVPEKPHSFFANSFAWGYIGASVSPQVEHGADMELRHIPFRKMNGLGNDFVVIDARAEPLVLSAAGAEAIAGRDLGAGCDQVIVLEPSRAADVFMRILNADGSEVSACGNASRCVAALLGPELGRGRLTIETRAGVLGAEVAAGGLVTVDMGAPRFEWDRIPLSQAFEDTGAIDLTHLLPDGRVLARPSVVNVGNPHCIFWVQHAGSYDLEQFGSMLEHHPLFPERANISLAEVTGEGALSLRVWERGAGITRACGTAACAAAVSAARTGRTGRRVRVELPGGTLFIEWREADSHILMTGPTEFEFDGVLHFSGNGNLARVERQP
jgi:diaminopimelate epimerase